MVKSERGKKTNGRARSLVAASGGLLPIFITHADRVRGPGRVIRSLPTGAIVICRDYDHPDRLGLALHLRALTKACGVSLLIAGDADLARHVGADGVHLPEYQLWDVPNLVGFGSVTAACHSRRSLKRAEILGVDMALVSPVFETRSHEDANPLGVHRLARLIAGAKVPVAALGGVNSHTVKALKGIGLSGFAAIDGFQQ